MRHCLYPRISLASALLAALACPPAARASAALALEKGCYSCHGSVLRGEAPSFERLSSRLSKYRGDAAAEPKFVDSFLAGEPLERIDAHERLTPESARLLIHWLIEGGK
jgi:cytochrome c